MNNKNYNIRKWKPADKDAIIHITLLAWEPIYKSFKNMMGEELYQSVFPDWRQEKREQLSSDLENDKITTFVVEKKNKVIGFINLVVHEKEEYAEIGHNAVHPDYQGQGIGTSMYEYVLDLAQEKGMDYVEVSTGGDPSHAPARRAYEKAGFSAKVPSVTYFKKL